MFAVRDEDAALDIVQDAMLKLTERYAEKPAAELPLLFQRILQNTVHDHFRRQKVRSTWTTVLSALGKGDDKDEDYDPLETLPVESGSGRPARPTPSHPPHSPTTLRPPDVSTTSANVPAGSSLSTSSALPRSVKNSAAKPRITACKSGSPASAR